MTRTLTVACVLLLGSTLIFADNWSGTLVDPGCFASAQGNTTHGEHPGSTDLNRTLRRCAPNAKTKSFALVQHDGKVVDFDPDSNGKAHEFILKGIKPPYHVTVAGEMSHDTIKVSTISEVK